MRHTAPVTHRMGAGHLVPVSILQQPVDAVYCSPACKCCRTEIPLRSGSQKCLCSDLSMSSCCPELCLNARRGFFDGCRCGRVISCQKSAADHIPWRCHVICQARAGKPRASEHAAVVVQQRLSADSHSQILGLGTLRAMKRAKRDVKKEDKEKKATRLKLCFFLYRHPTSTPQQQNYHTATEEPINHKISKFVTRFLSWP